MGRKRVQNATKVQAGGYNFRSKLEYAVYLAILEAGIKPEYEKIKYTLLEGFDTLVNGKKEHVRPITYTPDFTFKYNNILYIIEVKGYKTDVYTLKRKLILDRLSREDNTLFYEVKSKSDMEKILSEIKHLEVAL